MPSSGRERHSRAPKNGSHRTLNSLGFKGLGLRFSFGFKGLGLRFSLGFKRLGLRFGLGLKDWD